jgi:Icc-related predicted phosphoesterase
LEKAFSEIPENLDILVTHDPPTLNGMGKITQGRQNGKEAGNEILSRYILEKKPKYVFSGHIHSGNHKFEEYEGIKMANVSHVDETYSPVYSVLTFEI